MGLRGLRGLRGLNRANLRIAAAMLLAGTLVLLLLAAHNSTAASPAAQSASSQEQRARAIAAEAYVYGIAPLFEQQVIDRFPTNQLISITQLATPEDQLIVLPNVDTLYTVARLELAQGPLVVHVPDEHGRYYVLELLDAYTNVFGYIGRRVTGTRAGDYALTAPGWHGQLPPGVHQIRSPTPTVWIIGRTLVRRPRDVARVDGIQHQYGLTPLSGFGGPPLPATYLKASPLNAPPVPSGLAFYDALDTFLAAEPPPVSQRALLRRFASVGLIPGRAVSTENLSPAVRQGLLAGFAAGKREVTRYGDALKRSGERAHHGWVIPPAATGHYGSDYLLRAYIAVDALGANVPAEATYIPAFVDAKGRPLSGSHRYLLRFAAGELPPVKAFWSITLYGQNEFLVPNSINRYAIGNRTRGLHFGRGGSLTIRIQHSPPADRANWLPAPAGRFFLFMRLYQPSRAVLSGHWPLPTLTRSH